MIYFIYSDLHNSDAGVFMVNIFKIADSYLVLKDKNILPQERTRALNLHYNDYKMINGANYKSFDAEQSFVLGAELPLSQYKTAPNEYINQLKNKVTKSVPGYGCLYADFQVDDRDVPEAFKKMGGKIYNECIVYKLKYDRDSQSFILTDENGLPCKRHAYHAQSGHDSITMFLNIYAFEKDDYLRARTINEALKKNSVHLNQLSPRDKALATAYKNIIKRIQQEAKQKKFSFRHELTHVRNRMHENSLNLAVNRGKLSTENRFRLAQYDEKSAHLAENLEAIKLYLQNGDLNDFSVFPEKSQWLVKKLQAVSEDKRKQLLSNKQLLVAGTFVYWDIMHSENYISQFKSVVKKWAESSPVSFMGHDDAEYLKRRSKMLTFNTINPLTMQNELIDFSGFITKEIAITPEIKEQIIEPSNQIIQSRKERLNKYGLTKKVVNYVQQLHWKNNLLPLQKNNGNGR